MNLRLIKVRNVDVQHVSMADVNDFELSVMELSSMKICYESVYLRKFIKPFTAILINRLCPKFKPPVFCISMGVSGVSRGFPYMFFSSGNILYLFDAWPGTYNSIIKVVKAYNIKVLFITSRVSAENLQVLLPETIVIWCPEGCRTESYKRASNSEKVIDVLQMGRKYDLWHDKVVDKLQQSGVNYMYEKIKGEVIFKGREDFINGLSRSKISVCFPKSVTHSNQSGGITTMTHRYLQSVASKCLILGIIPDEMKELFGYDPGITVDMNDPASQVIDILRNYSDYLPLIEKNFSECMLNHGWNKRWMKVIEVLQNHNIWNREGKD